MSLDVSGTKFAFVTDPHTKYAFSPTAVFATLRTSKKTGRLSTDKETGEVIVRDGAEVQERKFMRWPARFIGEAAAPAKELHNQYIDIINGWLEKNIRKNEKTGQTFEDEIVIISKFVLSELDDGNAASGAGTSTEKPEVTGTAADPAAEARDKGKAKGA